jgi:hypothetical protein
MRALSPTFTFDDVVLVDVDARFHVVEIGDAHHFRAGELARADDALADAAGERADRAVRSARRWWSSTAIH